MFVPDNVRESLSDRTGSGIKSSREENAGQKRLVFAIKKKRILSAFTEGQRYF